MKRIVYSPRTIVSLPNIFGDGSDGDVTVSTTVNLARDMFYNNLTITAAGILNTNNFRVFVKNRFVNLGIVQCNGLNAVNDAGGEAAGGIEGTLPTDTVGPDGRTTAGVGTNSGTNNKYVARSSGSAGDGGSAGGNSGGNSSGVNSSVQKAYLANIVSSINPLIFPGTVTGKGVLPGLSGCSGGFGSGAAGASGGGGGAGGYVLIVAKVLDNSLGTIKSNGGNGGAATGTGNIGGGGGGQAGTIVLVGLDVAAGTSVTTGGSGGVGIGTGNAGSSGGNGNTITVPGTYG